MEGSNLSLSLKQSLTHSAWISSQASRKPCFDAFNTNLKIVQICQARKEEARAGSINLARHPVEKQLLRIGACQGHWSTRDPKFSGRFCRTPLKRCCLLLCMTTVYCTFCCDQAKEIDNSMETMTYSLLVGNMKQAPVHKPSNCQEQNHESYYQWQMVYRDWREFAYLLRSWDEILWQHLWWIEQCNLYGPGLNMEHMSWVW